MTVKEARKAVYDFVHETGLETAEAFGLVELLDDLVEVAQQERERSYDSELQRLYHFVYNQAISAARDAVMGRVDSSVANEEVEEDVGDENQREGIKNETSYEDSIKYD